jgi:RNA polymerase sigma factor (sigma-70 family)
MPDAFMDRMKEPASGVSDRPMTPSGGDFEAFFEAEHERLLRALFVVTGSAEVADELMQDAFVALWERWDRVGGMRDPTGYLYRTALNRFRSRLRAPKAAARRVIRADPRPDPFDAVDDRDLVVRALAGLSERQRAALVLTDLLDFDSEGRPRSSASSPPPCGPSPPRGGRRCVGLRSSLMSDVRAILERVGERVSAAPSTLERVARRRARRQRNHRLSAAAVAVAVSIAGTVGVILAFGGSTPAPAGSEGIVRIRLDGPPQPIAADELAAWVVVGTSETQNVLWRIDAATNEARPLPNTTGAGWPAVGEGFAWVTVCRGPEVSGCPESTAVLKLDPTTGETVETIALPGYGWQITTGFGSVWVSTTEGLVRIDAARGEVAATIPGDFNLLAAAGSWLWATRDRSIARIDPVTGQVVGTTEVPDPCVMVGAAGYVWTATCGGGLPPGRSDVLSRLDLSDGVVLSRSDLSHWGHLIGSEDELWLVQPADDGRSHVIVSIDPATGDPMEPGYVLSLPDEVRFTIMGLFPPSPFGAVASGSLWVTSFSSGHVLRVPLDELSSPEPRPTTTTSPSPELSPSGYFVELPEELTPASENPNGGGTLVATTNLPEGTRVSIGYEILDASGEASGGSGGISGLQVENQEIRADIDNQSCYYLVGQQGSSAGVSVTVTVSPEAGLPRSGPMGSDRIDAAQPDGVLETLGEGFEYLTGQQVRTIDGVRQLVATATYEWPEDSCAGTREAFVPEVCPTTPGQLQGDNLKQAMGEVMGAIGQGRLCELWQLALTPGVEVEHPWSEFRQEWSDWLFGRLGDVTAAGDPYASALTWEVVAEETVGNQTRATVAIALRGEPVAEVVLVSLPDWPAASEPGVIPFWGLVSYTLDAQ